MLKVGLKIIINYIYTERCFIMIKKMIFLSIISISFATVQGMESPEGANTSFVKRTVPLQSLGWIRSWLRRE